MKEKINDALALISCALGLVTLILPIEELSSVFVLITYCLLMVSGMFTPTVIGAGASFAFLVLMPFVTVLKLALINETHYGIASLYYIVIFGVFVGPFIAVLIRLSRLYQLA